MPGRILFVEPDFPANGEIVAALAAEGVESEHIASGAQARARLGKGDVDVLVVAADPDPDGALDLTRAARSLAPTTVVVIRSAAPTGPLLTEALRLGVREVLTAATGTQEALARLRRTLDHKHLEDENRRYRAGLEQLIEESTAALRESEAHYRAVADRSLTGIYIHQDGRLVYGNPQLARMLGYEEDPEAALGQDIRNFIHPEDQPWAGERLEKRLRGEPVEDHYEFRLQDRHGRPVCVELLASRIEFQGRPALMGHFIDVTERRKAERALRESEQRYRMLTENQQDVVFAIGPAGEIRYCSPAVQRFGGYDPAEVLGRNIADFIATEEDAVRSVHGMQSMATTLAGRSIELAYRAANGEVFPVEITAQPIVEGGEMRGAQCIMRDLRKRRHDEAVRHQTLQRFEAQKRALAELATHESLRTGELAAYTQAVNEVVAKTMGARAASVWRLNADGSSQDCLDAYVPGEGHLEAAPIPSGTRDQQMRELLRNRTIAIEDTESDPRARPYRDTVFRPRGIRAVLQAAVRDRGRLLGLISVAIAQGPREWYEDEVSFLAAVADQLALAFAAARRQETEREKERLEEQLLQSQRLETVGRLAGGVAHDFNNVLTVVSGNAEIILDCLSPNDPLHADVEEIRKAAERAGWLTGQLLAFSRRQVIDPRPVDLNQEVQRSEKMLRRIIGEDIELVFTPGQSLWLTHLDPRQVDQILVNLATNSRDAMPRGGRLSLSLQNIALETDFAAAIPDALPGAYVKLEVSDDGVGMSPATRAHIFEPFFTTKVKGKGTGLGLATVHGVVRQCGGFVAVYSEPGVGTTFHLYFPRLEGEAFEAIQRRENAPPARGSERILLAEDDDMVRRLTRRVLERLGYEVTEACDGPEAIARFERAGGDFAALVTDVVMPKMNGRELHDELRRRDPALRALFVSGHAEDIIAQHGILEPGVRFLNKPFTAAQLATALRETLD